MNFHRGVGSFEVPVKRSGGDESEALSFGVKVILAWASRDGRSSFGRSQGGRAVMSLLGCRPIPVVQFWG